MKTFNLKTINLKGSETRVGNKLRTLDAVTIIANFKIRFNSYFKLNYKEKLSFTMSYNNKLMKITSIFLLGLMCANFDYLANQSTQFWLFLSFIYFTSALKIYLCYADSKQLFITYVLPKLTENRLKFIHKFLDVFYGNRLIFYFNLIHVTLFTFLSLALRYSIITNNYIKLGDFFYIYVVIFFLFGVIIRFLDNLFVFIARQVQMVPSDINIDVDSPSEFTPPKDPENITPPGNFWTPNTNKPNWVPKPSVWSRISFSRNLRAGCEVVGLCFLTLGTYLQYQNIQVTKESTAVARENIQLSKEDIFSKERTNINTEYKNGVLSREEYIRELLELKNKYNQK